MRTDLEFTTVGPILPTSWFFAVLCSSLGLALVLSQVVVAVDRNLIVKFCTFNKFLKSDSREESNEKFTTLDKVYTIACILFYTTMNRTGYFKRLSCSANCLNHLLPSERQVLCQQAAPCVMLNWTLSQTVFTACSKILPQFLTTLFSYFFNPAFLAAIYNKCCCCIMIGLHSWAGLYCSTILHFLDTLRIFLDT